MAVSDAKSEQPEITPAMIAAWQRQQAEREEQERRALLADLIKLAEGRGYVIVSHPLVSRQGDILITTANWGVAKAE